jgi:hypothetical protein
MRLKSIFLAVTFSAKFGQKNYPYSQEANIRAFFRAVRSSPDDPRKSPDQLFTQNIPLRLADDSGIS